MYKLLFDHLDVVSLKVEKIMSSRRRSSSRRYSSSDRSSYNSDHSAYSDDFSKSSHESDGSDYSRNRWDSLISVHLMHA